MADGPLLPPSVWPSLRGKFAGGSKQDEDQAGRLLSALTASGSERINNYLEVFFTADLEPRQQLITARLQRASPILPVGFMPNRPAFCRSWRSARPPCAATARALSLQWLTP